MTAAIVVRKARDQLHLRRLSILGKMRFLLIIATLLVTYFVDAHVNGWSIKEISLLSKKFKVNNRDQVESLGVRQIRDATNCEEAYVETESPVFEECLEFLSLDSEEYSPQQLDLFCNERHCPGILRPVFRDIAILCHESEELLNFTTMVLPIFCTKNEFGDYCIDFLERLSANTSIQYFNECMATTFDGSCINACKQVAEYIETKFGCCYETLVRDASILSIPKEYIYPSDFFTKCYGKSIEPACSRVSSSVRPTRSTSMHPTRSKFNPGPTPN